MLNRKMQQCVANLEKSEERRLIAQAKLAKALETAEDAKRFAFAKHRMFSNFYIWNTILIIT